MRRRWWEGEEEGEVEVEDEDEDGDVYGAGWHRQVGVRRRRRRRRGGGEETRRRRKGHGGGRHGLKWWTLFSCAVPINTHQQ